MVQASDHILEESLPYFITSGLLRSTADADADLATALVMGVAWLEGCEVLQRVPDWLADGTRQAVQQLPAQHDPTLDAHPATGWMLLVSLADSIGAFELARALLDEIERLIAATTNQQMTADGTLDAMALANTNLRAVACARRGRLARQLGDVDSASEWYRAGLRLIRGLPKGDGWSTCTLGLAICAQSRGNFPETMRRCHTVLRAGTKVAKHNRFAAHLTLAMSYRRCGELERALHHAWVAFELADKHAGDRYQCLINVAEVSLRLGHARAARNGFLIVLRDEQPERNRIPAHAGLVEAETMLWLASGDPDSSHLRARIDALIADAHECRQPYERIKALLGALDAAVALRWFDQARRIDAYASSELESAAKRGTKFREFEFRRESILGRLGRIATTTSTPSAPPAEANLQRGHTLTGVRARHTVDRLMALSGIDDAT